MNLASPGQQEPLRDDGDPNGASIVHLPLGVSAEALGTVLVLPGGGYRIHADHETEPVAEVFRTYGFHTAMLRYRLAPHHQHPAMLHDAQRAVRLIRSDVRYGSGPVAVLGFSAGGHLAATVSTHGDAGSDPEDPLLETCSARPDAAVLAYPVIMLNGPYAHGGSGNSLLGERDPDAFDPSLNLDRAVDPQTPPTFLWHTADDTGVPVQNSVHFAEACWRHGVSCELHVFPEGTHGLGLAPGHPASVWSELAAVFLKQQFASHGDR
ncbi:MAG: alpha/beta hydrolase [Planctomycetota bacterium]